MKKKRFWRIFGIAMALCITVGLGLAVSYRHQLLYHLTIWCNSNPHTGKVITKDNNKLPVIYIHTSEEPTRKKTKGFISIEGNGIVEDIAKQPMKIKVRGNSTAIMAKHPFAVSLKKKIKIGELSETKHLVLLANYRDPTLLHTQVAMKAARLLGIPTANHVIPVNVVVNGEYRGVYDLTEKIGNNVNNLEIDPKEGALLTMDKYTGNSGNNAFASDVYGVRVLLKRPSLKKKASLNNISEKDVMGYWDSVFADLEHAVKDLNFSDGTSNERLFDLIDSEDFVDFMLIQNFAHNKEYICPTSVFLFKRNAQDKFHFGPLWDFDRCFGYSNTLLSSWTDDSRKPLITSKDVRIHPNCEFFIAIVKTKEFQESFKTRWEFFVKDCVPQLYQFIDRQTDRLELAAEYNAEMWPVFIFKILGHPSSSNLRKKAEILKKYIHDRVEYISNSPNFGFFAE